jgi:hypothetical protein
MTAKGTRAESLWKKEVFLEWLFFGVITGFFTPSFIFV